MVDRSQNSERAGTLDEAEVARFAAMADEWWDAKGKFRPLHQIGPARLEFIRGRVVEHFGLDAGTAAPFAGLKVLDVGCGGGLVSEPLARLGAQVTGIDPAEQNIQVAALHGERQGLEIDYRAVRVEDLVAGRETFDVVVCLEVVEHVPDVAAFVASLGALVRPGGIAILSTINRTLKSFALAIVGAEYILRWLPVGTHQWDRLIAPEELQRHLSAAGLRWGGAQGLIYNPLSDRWMLGRDTDVNYLAFATKDAGA